jgi:hypothetical protein
MATFPRLCQAWWSIFTEKQASSTFTFGARRGTTGCLANLRWGGFNGFTSSGEGGFTSVGVGGSTSAGGGRGTSSLLRFLDGSLDAMRLLEEEEALGLTSW